MKTTVVLAALVCTYILMLNVVVKKEADAKMQRLQKNKMASVHTDQSGF